MLISGILFCLTWSKPINPKSPQIALIAMPTLKMARQIHWLPLLSLLEKLPIVKRCDKSDFRIVWQGERPDLVVRGADRQGDRLRGLNPAWVGLDEYQDFSPEVWDKVIQPALVRNVGYRALVIGTPKGKNTHFYEFAKRAHLEKTWAYFHATSLDNPFISRKALQDAERQLPAKVYRQEHLASFEDFDGQLFPHITSRTKIDIVPSGLKAVLAGADWGDINPAIVVIGISHDNHYYLLDQWHNTTGQPVTADEVEDKAAELERAYGIKRWFLPDDRPASIRAFRQYGTRHGLEGMTKSVQVVRSQPGVIERALIGNSLFYQERLWFCPNTHCLYNDFAGYHRAKNSNGQMLSEPAKGQADHSVDATLYVIGQLEGRYITKMNTA
ncbi:MAG: hypothetical protein U5M23_00375 [Marinagarivorans sp.]|nr:hypothetical protein [Marinagarivorans sp.]